MAERRALTGHTPEADRRGAAPFFERVTREGGSDERALKMLFGDDPRGYESHERKPRTEAGRRAREDRATSDEG